ncbi:hypothetical protein AMTRI_Chr03g46690 [Amborella trichopoda]|uniref:Uncharacterized protein n=1 Tax=Amborella trichopoda TaxID=13333 RepID=W1PBL4_AMBTC|nr:hypothetical protein AMTR_s00133p00067990 [Amborella trichopoda]
MTGALQRSSVSFRRQGSSGLIWDDRFLSGEIKPNALAGATDRCRPAGGSDKPSGSSACPTPERGCAFSSLFGPCIGCCSSTAAAK